MSLAECKLLGHFNWFYTYKYYQILKPIKKLKLPCVSFHFQESYFGNALLQDSPKKRVTL